MTEFDAKEVVEIVATEGANGLRRRLMQSGELGSDLGATESLYWRLKEGQHSSSRIFCDSRESLFPQSKLIWTPSAQEIPVSG